MANKLLGDWRLRVSNSNSLLFENSARISFFDASTSTAKEVFADITSTVSLGSVVDLDSEGYVPTTGIWLGDGAYSAKIETLAGTDILGVEDWVEEWSIPYITGSESLVDTSISITSFDTVQDLRAFDPDGSNAYCHGYDSVNDGGSGNFYWNALSLATDDEGSVIKPTSYATVTPGRWIRIFTEIPNIRQWGVNESRVDVKVRILNAQDYTIDNDLQLIYPSGSFNLSIEDLIIKSNGIVEDNCKFVTTGTITLSNCVVNTMNKIADSVSSVNISLVKPEWYGAVGDNSTNDIEAFKSAYDDAEASSEGVYLTNQYFLEGSQSFNTSGSVGTIFATDSKVTFGGLSANVCLGDITTEGWDGTDCIEAASYEYLVPHGKMYERWFNGLTGDDFSSLMNSRSYNVTFVWTSKFTFETSYTEISNVTHVFEDNASWQLTAACSFSIEELDIKRLFDLASLSYLLGTVKIFNSGEDAIELTTNLSLIADDIIFTGCRFTIDGDISVTFSGYGKFNDCVFSKTNTADSLTISSVGQLYVYKCRSLLETAFEGNYITAENNTFEKVTLNGSAAAVLKTMWFYNNIFRDTVTLLSNATNTIVTNVKITNNTFALELASTRILTSGSFMNAQKTHFVVIKDNLASTNDEQTYVPMTQGIYLYRRNEMPTTELVVTPDETIFDITLDVYDDVKYSALAVLKRQIFALAGDNDINWFSKFKFYNCYVDCYVGTTLTYTYDMYFQTKKMTIAHLKTGGHFDVDRLPVSDASTILPYGDGIYLVGTVDFSIYDELTYDYKLTPHLLP